jgi:hypothetical protein
MLLHTNNMKKGMTHLYFPSIDPRACFKLHSHIVTLQPPALPYSLPVPDLPGLPANNIRALLFPGALHKAAGPKVGKLLACRPPAVMHPHNAPPHYAGSDVLSTPHINQGNGATLVPSTVKLLHVSILFHKRNFCGNLQL